ncbi:hypothetical protein [Succinivibrio dextrinosolvens]|uniref:hypothetical protein n=1 Tax=Succinivibrio dextrinosolvens TaxID=83771 RepID=UPI0019246A9E|nr:hypothetical protein [Succinivibrio dextrinosolvens]
MPKHTTNDELSDSNDDNNINERASKEWRSRQASVTKGKKGALQSEENDSKTPNLVLSLTMVRKYTFIYIFTVYFSRNNKRAWERSIYRLLGWDGEMKNIKNFRYQLWRQITSLRNDFGVIVEREKAPKGEQEGEGSAYYVISDFGVFNPFKLTRMLDENSVIFETAVANLVTTSQQGVKKRIRPELSEDEW